MSLRLLELLGVIVIFQLLFIAFFLFTHPKGKRLSNALLGSFFGAVALNMFDGLYVLTGWADANPHLAFIGGSCSFLFGPLLYFYTQSVVYREYRLPRTAVLHALPFLLVTGLTGYYEFALAVIIAALFYFTNGIIFKALRQPEIFGGVAPGEVAPEAVKPAKYASSALMAPERESHLAGRRRWMETQKPYLNPDLTIEELSGQVPVKVLSQVINESLGQNFFDFVNTYRVEEAKQLLTNARDPKITVLEVMYQAGFNSKSSFNTAFMKIALTTPSAYKKGVKGE